ncbi:MAG TPA: hypothetical protein VN018_00535 [Brevundimonas sp.]|nr:hypothetical protein [Brevundimonas sp.]
MPTLAEGVENLKAEIADAEARLVATTGVEVGDQLYREWLEDQIKEMRDRLAAYQAELNPRLGTV